MGSKKRIEEAAPKAPKDQIQCLKCGEMSDTTPNDRFELFMKPHLRSCASPKERLYEVFIWHIEKRPSETSGIE